MPTYQISGRKDPVLKTKRRLKKVKKEGLYGITALGDVTVSDDGCEYKFAITFDYTKENRLGIRLAAQRPGIRIRE